MSVRKAAALAMAQLGVAAFFVSGIAPAALGGSAFWFVLAATVFAAFRGAADIESWSLLIPGGFVGRVRMALGGRAAAVAKAAALMERLLLGVLASVDQAGVTMSPACWRPQLAAGDSDCFVRPEDLATPVALTVSESFGSESVSVGVWTASGWRRPSGLLSRFC